MKWLKTDLATQFALKELDATIEFMDHAGEGMAEQIGRIIEVNKRQGERIDQLKALILSLAEVVVDAGLVEEKVLTERFEAVMNPPVKEPHSAVAPLKRCDGCGKEAAPADFYFTEFGERCSACYAASL